MAKDKQINNFLSALDHYLSAREELAAEKAGKYTWEKAERVKTAEKVATDKREELNVALSVLLEDSIDSAISEHTNYFNHNRGHLDDY